MCSNIDCKTVGKKKSTLAVKVATGADFESDDDESKRKRALRKTKNDHDEYGDSYASETEIVKLTKDDTSAQIRLLEELAEKMRLEKE